MAQLLPGHPRQPGRHHGRDKMMLGALNIISGLPQRSYYSIYDQRKVYMPLYNIIYGGFASKKGLRPAIQQAAAAPPKSAPQVVLATYGIARQRTNAHGPCRNFVIRKRYEGIRLAGRCSKAAPMLLRGCIQQDWLTVFTDSRAASRLENVAPFSSSFLIVLLTLSVNSV